MIEVKFIPYHWRATLARFTDKGATFRGAFENARDHYLNGECTGLKDGDAYLMAICDCTPEQWEVVGPELFKRDYSSFDCFMLENGRWHHMPTRDLFQAAKQKLESASAGGRAGAKNRWPSKHAS